MQQAVKVQEWFISAYQLIRKRGNMEKYLLDCLNDYTSSDAYPLHMPGHKRQISHFSDPFAIDITEIEGFDNLHHAEGILLEAQKRAAKLYGADETWYLVNGSTCGILAAVSACVRRGGRILMARNCHKAAYHAAFLNGLQVTWLYPEIDMDTGICGSISPGQVREALEVLRQGDTLDAGQPVVVLLTSPTYDGVVSDIRAIAREVHQAGGILIVDEAHGAHFVMHPYFPESALSCGADIVINSLHKTMPSLTQTALLHVKGPRVDRVRLRKYLDIYQSSSPSYVLMAGMDECVRMMETCGQELFDAFVGRLEALRKKLKRMKVLHLVTGEEPELQAFAYDASKVIIAAPVITASSLIAERIADTAGGLTDVSEDACTDTTAPPLTAEWISDTARDLAGAADAARADTTAPLPTAKRYCNVAMFSGPVLGRMLRERYHLEPEMEAEHYVTAIMTVADTQEGFDRLERALLEIDGWLSETLSGEEISRTQCEMPTPCNQRLRTDPGEKISQLQCEVSTPGNQRLGSIQAGEKVIADRSLSTDVALEEVLREEVAANCSFSTGVAPIEVMTMEEADRYPHEPVSLEACAGRTAAEFVYLYPPGIPLLVPGEQIPDEFGKLVWRYREMGLKLQGLADYRAETIQCVVTG